MHAKQTDIHKLLIGTKVFLIPIFQRTYKWGKSQWTELFQDVMEQYELPEVRRGDIKEGEGHFLGSLVLHPAPGPASTVARYMVIDGQQRLTTLLTMLAALRDVRASHISQAESWTPDAYNNQYLTNPFNQQTDADKYRLLLGVKDRDDFIQTIYGGKPKGQIGLAYTFFKTRFEGLSASWSTDGGAGGLSAIEGFNAMERAILLRLLVVEINTSPGDNINHIFHTLNYAGMKLHPVDLIRNFLLMRVSADEVEAIHAEHWKPMEDELREEGLRVYFWAQLVRFDKAVTQKELYGPFEQRISSLEKIHDTAKAVKIELARLHEQLSLYRAIKSPSETNIPDALAGIEGVLRELAEWGSQTPLPITLEVADRVATGRSTPDEGDRALRHVLSYLVRRSLSGVPTNNLNRILSALPSSLNEDEPIDLQISGALGQGQKYWPTDGEVAERILSTPLYLTSKPTQIAYILRRIDASLNPKEPVSAAELTVEHLQPQKLDAAWKEYLGKNAVSIETAESRTHVIGNLTLTGHNSELGRKLMEGKAKVLAESNIGLNRLLSDQESWLPEDIDARSRMLGEIAAKIWKRPTAESPPEPPEVGAEFVSAFSPATLLAAIPPGRWSTPEEISALSGTVLQQVVSDLELLDSALVARVREADGAIPTWMNAEQQAAASSYFDEFEEPDPREGVSANPPLSSIQLRDVLEAIGSSESDEGSATQ